MLIPRGWAGETALSSVDEPGCEGSCDWGVGEGELWRRGEGACAGGNAPGTPAQTGSPCLGWVSVFLSLALGASPSGFPAKLVGLFDFTVLRQGLCGNLAIPSASVSLYRPLGLCLIYAGFGLGLPSWAAPNLKDLLSFSVDLPCVGLAISFSPPSVKLSPASHSPHLL